MCPDKCRVPVPLSEPCESSQDRLESREWRAGEMPIGMGLEFFPAFIGVIERLEKGDRIGDVDQHRQMEFACRFPQWNEAFVVNRYQLPFVIPNSQAEGFPYL